MSNKKFRKVAISTIAASTAIAAVAPAVSADTAKSYPDVKPGNDGFGAVGSHYNPIMALSDRGIVNGADDGHFYPWNNVVRGQIAKMLTQALELETPANVSEVLSVYNDVDANNDYAKEIAAVTEAGVFTGNDDGEFQEYTDITREQMATALVRAFNLQDKDNGEDVKVNLSNVSEPHRDAVQTLANLGITNELDDFRAYENISRAAFASMLYDTLNVVEHEVGIDLAVESASAINAKEFQVKFNKAVDKTSAEELSNYVFTHNNNKYGDKHDPISNFIGDSSTHVSLSPDNKTVTFRVNDGVALDNGDKYSVDVKSGVLSADGNETVKPFGDPEKVFNDQTAPVLEKTSLDASDNLVLTYDEPVDLSADYEVTIDGQKVDRADTTDVVGNYNVVIPAEELDSAEGLSVGKHDVVVYNARDFVSNNGNGGNLDRMTKTSYEVKEGEAPVVESVEQVSNHFNEFKIHFNKKVHDTHVVVKKGNTEFYNQEVGEDGKSITVKLPLSNSQVDAEGALTHLFEEGDNAVNVSVEVSDYKDSDDIYGDKYSTNLTLERDSEKPTEIGTTKNSITDEGKLEITLNRGDSVTDYTEAEVADQDKITVIDNDGIKRTVKDADVTDDKLVIEIDTADQSKLEKMAPFAVEFDEGALELPTDQVSVPSKEYSVDEFTNSIFNNKFTSIVNAAADSDYKVIEAVNDVRIINDEVDTDKGHVVNKIEVEYKDVEMGKSATQLENYTLDGEALPTNSKISMNADNNTVTITIPGGTFAKDAEHKLFISKDVKTAKGEHVVGNQATKEEYHSDLNVFKDDVQPELAKAKFVVDSEDAKTTNTIELTFNEDIKGAPDADNFTVLANDGIELEVSVSEIDEDGKVELTLTDDKEINVGQTVQVNYTPENAGDITDEAGNYLSEGIVTVEGKVVVKDGDQSSEGSGDNEDTEEDGN